MIRLLRKIHQQMLTEGKFSRYLLYALGEIILIVIGILIALQINILNENRKASYSERELYQKTINDLNIDLELIEQEIELIKTFQDAHYQVYNESKGKEQYNPDIDYNTLRSLIHINPITSDNLSNSRVNTRNSDIQKLFNEYSRNEALVLESYEIAVNMKVNLLRPFFRKYNINNSQALFNTEPYNWSEVTEIDVVNYEYLKAQYGNPMLDQILSELRLNASYIILRLEDLRAANIQLKQTLENELKGD